MPDWLTDADAGVRIAVRVTPRASANAIEGERDGRLLVRVTAAPEDGKANAAVCKLLAKRLGIGKTSLEVVSGVTARNKVVSADGIEMKDAERALAA